MRFALHDLHPNQFEDLVVALCHELLGAGVQEFSTGPDGGRDAKFVGAAQEVPSRAEPFKGTIIIQAKHTESPIGKVSDADFSGTAPSSTISKEIRRVRRMKEKDEIDHYLLFSNRRLAGEANERICKRLRKDTGVESIRLFGNEDIERFLKRYRYLADQLREFEYDLPLRATPDELAEVINAIVHSQSETDWFAESALPPTPQRSGSGLMRRTISTD